MTPAQHQRAKDLFAVAISLAPGARAEYLTLQSADDPDVRAEVERLLQAEPTRSGDLGELGRAVAALTDVDARPRMTGRTIGHYLIERPLGAGGMGEVYLARDRALGRQVALKVLPAGLESSLRERLLREAWASARVQHPGIATFFDAGRAVDVDYIAMEYVPGQTLRERLRSGALPVGEAVELVAGVLEALVHAHHAGVLHRDIKPENIVVTGEGRAKLLDFGLAKGLLAAEPADSVSPTLSADAEIARVARPRPSGRVPAPDALTRMGAMLGTVGYMAPEQVRGEAVDERADVFAVGAVLYEVLSGAPAFPGRTADERLAAVVGRDPDSLEAGRFPAELDGVLRRSLARDRSERYRTAGPFLADLREATGGPARSLYPATLAILDFRCPSGDAALVSLATTLVESLAAMLRSVPGIGIVPPVRVASLGPEVMSTVSPSEIGLRLGCSAVLSGTLHGQDGTVTLTAQLDDVTVIPPIVAESLVGSPGEVVQGLERLATALARALGAVPPRRVDRPSLEAAELYARGRRLALTTNKRLVEEACDLLERAVALAPDYAPAHATLACAHGFHANFDQNTEELERAALSARRAVALDPTLGDGFVWGGYVLHQLERWRESEAMLRRAAELEPRNPVVPYFRASALWGVKRFEDVAEFGLVGPEDPPVARDNWWRWRSQKAIGGYQVALRLNPMFEQAWIGLGWYMLEESRFDEARWCLARAVELEPKSVSAFPGPAGYLAECSRRQGRLGEARTQFQQGLEALERTDHMYRDTMRGLFLCGLGRTALDQDEREAAGAAFRQAVLHLRGRPKARCGGHVLVNALSGLARAEGHGESLDEAVQLFEQRRGFDFRLLWGIDEGLSLWELHRAAVHLGRDREAADLLRRALDAGSSAAHASVAGGPPPSS